MDHKLQSETLVLLQACLKQFPLCTSHLLSSAPNLRHNPGPRWRELDRDGDRGIHRGPLVLCVGNCYLNKKAKAKSFDLSAQGTRVN